MGNYYPDHLFHSARRLLRRIALTGYSTLSQLLSFRLDKIKFDRSFVAPSTKKRCPGNRARHPRSRKRIGLKTTAEGVEDAGQLAYLKANGCTEGQGYLFGKTVAAADIPALLNCVSPPLQLPELRSNGRKRAASMS